MRKFKKNQMDAIESLEYDIDELDNKPRRLFSSLRKFAKAFVPSDDQEYKERVFDKIDEFEDMYYKNHRISELCGDLVNARRETELELLSNNNGYIKNMDKNDDYHIYRHGVQDATLKLIKKMMDILIEYDDFCC